MGYLETTMCSGVAFLRHLQTDVMEKKSSPNTADPEWQRLFRLTAEGCEDAADQLMERFQTQIRLEARSRLASAPLTRRLIDSMDITQSVYLRFIHGLRAQTIEQRDERQMVAFLRTVCRNKVKEKIRFHSAHQRDLRRNRSLGAAEHTIEQSDAGADAVETRDWIESLRKTYRETDLQIASLRSDGLSWSEVSKRIGLPADACRMRLERLRHRASKNARLEEQRHAVLRENS